MIKEYLDKRRERKEKEREEERLAERQEYDNERLRNEASFKQLTKLKQDYLREVHGYNGEYPSILSPDYDLKNITISENECVIRVKYGYSDINDIAFFIEKGYKLQNDYEIQKQSWNYDGMHLTEKTYYLLILEVKK